MARWWLPVVAAFFVVGLAILPAPDTASQQTPYAQATWTLSPRCLQLFAEAGVQKTTGKPMNRDDAEELEGCMRGSERHAPPRRPLGPITTPSVFMEAGLPDANLSPLALEGEGSRSQGW